MIVTAPARTTPLTAARPVLEYQTGIGNLHAFALETPALQKNYDAVWNGFRKRFT